MSARRVLAGSLTALLLPASLLLISGTSSASDTPSETSTVDARKAKPSKVKLTAYPQLAQQGKKPAAAGAAQAAFSATVKPAKAGRPVVLQVKSGGGWKKAAKGKTAKNGKVELTAKARFGSVYRLQAKPFKGTKAGVSKPVSIDQWQTPLFSDEFAGGALSTTWSGRGTNYEPTSLRACSKGHPSAASVSGGTLKLSVLKDPTRSDKCTAMKDGKSSGKFAYRLNGHVGTQNAFAFKYGYAAARMKMHKSRGQHSAFWMQPNVGNLSALTADKGGAEIDIIEYFGDKHPLGGLTSFSYSYNGAGKLIKNGDWIKNSESFLKNKGDNWSKNYHVFSVQWTPREYIFRIDGKETWRTKVGVSGVEQYLILSMLSSDYALALGGDKVLPQNNNVDWVRVWGL